jgi:hypothetical protein
MSNPTMDLQAARLLCFIYPSRWERVLDRVMGLSWGISETGLFGWIGDRADDARSRSASRRARKRSRPVV